MLQIHLYDSTNATRRDVLARATDIAFTRTISGTDEIGFRVPRGDEQLGASAIGGVVRIHDTDTGIDLAVGVISGTVNYGDPDFVVFQAISLLSRLATIEYPPDYIFEGTLSSNAARFVQSFDWRRITAASYPSGAEGTANDEIMSWNGEGGGNQVALKQNVLVTEIVITGEDGDSSGVLMLTGSGAGTDEPPFTALTGLYESPFLDFRSAPTTFDRLRYGGQWRNNPGGTPPEEVGYRVASWTDILDMRTFSGAIQYPADPEQGGVDISATTARRFIAVEFNLKANTPVEESPAVFWFEVIARRAIAGISAGTFPATSLDARFPVSGQSPLRVLEQLSEVYNLEYRLSTAGVLDVQLKPSAAAIGAVWGTDRRNTCTFVEGIHGSIVRYEIDDSELANYVIAVGTGGGNNAIVVTVQDTASQSRYGIRQATIQTSKQTLDALETEARNYLAEKAVPRKTLEFDVLDTPDGAWTFAPGDLVRIVSRLGTRSGELGFYVDGAFAAMELYTFAELEAFTFQELETLPGNLINENLRIISERREQTDAGVVARIELESRPPRFIDELVSEIADLKQTAVDANDDHETGTDWTPIITDGNAHEFTVLLDFAPTKVHAVVIEIEDTTAGAFYSPHGGTTQVDVVYTRIGEFSMIYAVKRMAGANSYRAHVLWEADGQRRKTLKRRR